jgi:peptidoglycan/xylan/chitin deacetylase (PgdA/CDA1 family)
MDAETGFLRSGNYSPQPLSRGDFGPRAGVPRILKPLEKYNVPATFFIPAVDAILKAPQKRVARAAAEQIAARPATAVS